MKKITDKQGYEWLEEAIKGIKPRTKMYYFLRLYLKPQGYWKNKARGDGGKQSF